MYAISTSESPTAVNARFNANLARQIAGTLPTGHIYQLGMPGEILKAAGIPDFPIELSSERLAYKSSPEYKSNHPFPLECIYNLPKALNEPIAVFDSSTKQSSNVILTELKHNGANFVTTLRVRKSENGRSLSIDVNSIRSIYPKDSKNGILYWINNGLMKWVDKDKMKGFLSTQWPNYIAGGKEAFLIAKILQTFENPK